MAFTQGLNCFQPPSSHGFASLSLEWRQAPPLSAHSNPFLSSFSVQGLWAKWPDTGSRAVDAINPFHLGTPELQELISESTLLCLKCLREEGEPRALYTCSSFAFGGRRRRRGPWRGVLLETCTGGERAGCSSCHWEWRESARGGTWD